MAGPEFLSPGRMLQDYLEAAESDAASVGELVEIRQKLSMMGMTDPGYVAPPSIAMRLDLNVVNVAAVATQEDLRVLIAHERRPGEADWHLYVVGDCELCGRPTPLAPALQPPRQMAAGRALAMNYPASIHVCGYVGRQPAGDDRGGAYL